MGQADSGNSKPAPAPVNAPRRALRPSRRASEPRMSLNLAPMIDVTFLLLIFFLLTTTFQRAEGVLGANLPHDRGRPAVSLPISPIVVRVASTGPAASDFALRIDDFAAQPVSFSELSGFLVDIRQNEGFDVDTPVVIVAGADTPWELVVECWNAAVRARCRNIAFGGEGR